MSSLPDISAIVLRCREASAAEDSLLTLREKFDQLLAQGFERDDLFAIAIPLLMQGKVRLDVGDLSERIELDDPSLRQTRPNAIRVFEQYFESAGKPASSAAAPTA